MEEVVLAAAMGEPEGATNCGYHRQPNRVQIHPRVPVQQFGMGCIQMPILLNKIFALPVDLGILDSHSHRHQCDPQ